MENNGKEGRLIEFVFLGNLYWAVQPTGFLERYCQSFLRFNWVNKVEKEVIPFFHFEKMCCGFYSPVGFATLCKILLSLRRGFGRIIDVEPTSH